MIIPDLAPLAFPVDKLDLLAGNPRRGDVAAMVRILERFGQHRPAVARKKRGGRGEVLAGNHMLLAARQLGWTELAVAWVTDDDKTAKARAIADNRPAQLGSFDDELLAAMLAEFGDDADLLAAVSYSDADLRELLRGKGNGRDPDLAVPVPEEPVSKLGDLWLLGDHRLLCGDACDPEEVSRLLGDAKPELLATDPPYGVQLDPRWRDGVHNKLGPGALPYMTEGHVNRTLSGDTRADWSEAFELVPSLSVGYVWHAGRYAGEVAAGLERIGFGIVQQIIWDKTLFVIGRQWYHWGHEPCWLARKPGYKLKFRGKRNQSTVWRAASPKQIMSGSDEEKYDHPAQKPAVLFQTPIRNHLRAGEVVYDPFLGSGTCLIAAESCDVRCYGLELDPRYVDVICQRFEQFTGVLPVLEATGEARSFTPTRAAPAKR